MSYHDFLYMTAWLLGFVLMVLAADVLLACVMAAGSNDPEDDEDEADMPDTDVFEIVPQHEHGDPVAA